METVLIALILLVLIGIGYVIGIAMRVPSTATVPTSGVPAEACRDFCRDWQVARINLCNAEADLRVAQDRAKLLWEQARMLYASALALFAAAAVAAIIPIIGVGIAVPLFSAGAIMLAAWLVAVGMYLSLANHITMQLVNASEAQQNESIARAAVIEHCPPEEAAACLATPSPC